MPRDRVAEECGLNPDLLEQANAAIDRPWAIVRYGKLCHEYYPSGTDEVTEVFSATKTLSAVVTGIAAHETRDLARSGRKTGPLSDTDRVDHWLDEFSFNPEARVAHVLAMVAHNENLGLEQKSFAYDAAGEVQINRLSDVINTAIDQDPARFGEDLEEFTHRFLYEPVGMTSSRWTSGRPDKVFAFSWEATTRDMARLGLLMLNGGAWSGEQILSEDWVYKMTHPSFEDASPSYGYLTWLSTGPGDFFFGSCAPASIFREHPHGLSESSDCGLDQCTQENDVGVWSALGLFGQIITGHPGLDMVIVAKDIGDAVSAGGAWAFARPALVAEDPRFNGDEDAFCQSYASGGYAPDLR
ncbi:MAG: serine hydrolase [Deltaproteobacteria bacterium]|nr:serine hydrolase [Deltaproteobacteria bacterium]